MEELKFNFFEQTNPYNFGTQFIKNHHSSFLFEIGNGGKYPTSLLAFYEDLNSLEIPIYSSTLLPQKIAPLLSEKDDYSLSVDYLLGDSFVLIAEAVNLPVSSVSTGINYDLFPAIAEVRQSLGEFLQRPDYLEKLELAFGSKWEPETATTLISELVHGSYFPTIEIVDGEQLQSPGAFSPQTNTIYLSQQFLETNQYSLDEITPVITEELGHYIDAQLNLTDSHGDEGQLFALLVQGVELTPQQIQELKAENDWKVLNINGQTLWVEQSTNEIVGTPGRDYLEGTPESDRIIGGFAVDIIFGYGGSDTFV